MPEPLIAEVCPWANCGGVAQMVGREETTIGNIMGVDPNSHTDTFECGTCYRRAYRIWKWMKERTRGVTNL